MNAPSSTPTTSTDHRSRGRRGLSAARTLAADPETAYLFLGDLENHWDLADRFVRVIRLDGPLGARDRGEIRVRGPLGLSRRVLTRVVAKEAPSRIEGIARVGRRTEARISWSLQRDADGSRVELTATELSLGALDRVLLALGGRLWLRRRFTVVLDRLAQRLTAEQPARLADARLADATTLA